jgi:hypothetical protein
LWLRQAAIRNRNSTSEIGKGMDMELLTGLIAICIGIIGVTMCLVKYALIKFNDLWDDDGA